MTAEMRLRAAVGTHFWSNGRAWGTCQQTADDAGFAVDLRVRGGCLRLGRFVLEGAGACEWEAVRGVEAGERLEFRVR